MARFLVKASEFKNVCKAVNDRKLAELKKEIIEILKKQDENEVKKAVDYFNSQELHYTHLEKSLVSGKWIEKAGYGIGTVRIWKGKKYKKIAPGKWARVFEKEGRGTNIAIGKLIAKVQKIDNVEDLMAFVMQNKQRFVDENGVDLPVLDKLRAAVDARNGNVGSKGKRNDNPYEVTDEERKQAMNNPKTKLLQMADAVRNAEEGTKEYDNALKDFQDAREKFIEDQGMEEYKKIMPEYPKGKSKKPEEKKKTFKQEMNELYDAQDKAWEGFESGSEIKSTPENSKKFYDRVKKFVDDNNIKLSKKHYDEIEEMNGHSFNEALALAGAYGEDAKKKELARNKEYSQKYKGQILDLSMIDEFKESDDNSKTYWIQDNRGNRLTNEDAKKKIIGQMKYLAELEDMAGKKLNNRTANDIRYYIDYLKDRLNPEDRKEIESEFEKTKNEESNSEDIKRAKEKIKQYAGKKINSNEISDINILDDGERSGFLTFEFKSGNDKYKMTYDYGFGGEKGGVSIKKIESEEESKKESFTPISKDKMKSMSDDELKDYEAKLEKDLLATSRNDPDYVEKYNHWREVHGENNDRFHQAIEDEARAEKQAEADAKSAKEKEIKEKYHGYFDSRSGLDKARDLKTLEKKYNFDGKVMSSKEFVEQAMDNGVEIKEREVNKLDYPSRTRWNRMNGYEQDEYEKRIKAAGKKTVYSINGFEFPKTVVDYAKFYKEKGNSKSGSEKPSKSEIAIKNKATSLAGAFGYSKTYATKMGSPFNLELAQQTVDEELDWDDGSKKALKEELRRIYSEKKVQKSLFDDFIMDVFEADEDEEIEDAIKADETEYNDYSAEQPELFNSTAMKVREALDRIKNQVL